MPKIYKMGSVDPAVQHFRRKTVNDDIELGWDRHEKMQDVCGFGELGICCRNCLMGPCRINPFGEEPRRGICGIDADGIVARNLCRMIAAGTAAHSDHGMHIVEILERINRGEPVAFEIRDWPKFEALCRELGISPDHENRMNALLQLARDAISGRGVSSAWLTHRLTPKRKAVLHKLQLLPDSVDGTIRETLHRTHMGVDADYQNLLSGAIKCAMADFLGMDVASSLTDMLLGTPSLRPSMANLGVIDRDAVNIAIHGHHPLVGASIVAAAPAYMEKAKEAGAPNGINLVGICCSGNELLMRHGVPLATNAASQEIAILTGALDAMVVDVQCIMPSLADICECFHTKLITTMSIAKIPGALHVEFVPETAAQTAGKIIEEAIIAFKKRNRKKVDIPNICEHTLVGFSPEAIIAALSTIDAHSPVNVLLSAISSGAIQGIVLFAGCNNYKVLQDHNFKTMAHQLAARNVLILATGCAAGAFGKMGLLSPAATSQICGPDLAHWLTSLGEAAGLQGPFPPVWHMGSCVDNSRVVRLAAALANALQVDIDELPLAASAPELMSEKSVAIGTWAVAMGIATHVGIVPPVMGGKAVTRTLTESLRNILGAKFIVETDPMKAADALWLHIQEKRLALGLHPTGV